MIGEIGFGNVGDARSVTQPTSTQQVLAGTTEIEQAFYQSSGEALWSVLSYPFSPARGVRANHNRNIPYRTASPIP